MKRLNDHGVSPVVGVMLMLVVTIIIAAVVSGFAGSLASDDSKAPQAVLEATPVIKAIEDTDNTTWGPDYPVDFEAKNGIMFEHKGGDAFSLNDIAIEFENQGVTMIVTAADTIGYADWPDDICLPSGTTDGGYFVKIGSDISDKTIAPGDKFMFYADSCYVGSDGTDYLLWIFGPGYYGYGPLNDFYKWSVIDQRSSKPISSGEFLLK